MRTQMSPTRSHNLGQQDTATTNTKPNRTDPKA